MRTSTSGCKHNQVQSSTIKHNQVQSSAIKQSSTIKYCPQVASTIKYTGHGFVPCKGYAPTPNWCRCWWQPKNHYWVLILPNQVSPLQCPNAEASQYWRRVTGNLFHGFYSIPQQNNGRKKTLRFDHHPSSFSNFKIG